jgi:large subunit ribosomal protein L6
VSRVGKNPITIPAGVTLTLTDGILTVKGPKGELKRPIPADITVSIEDDQVTVTRPSDGKVHRSLHGTTRANIQNMVSGVSEGFKRQLELVGVGYRIELQGTKLLLTIGYSHLVAVVPPEGVTFTVESNTAMTVWGIDKQLVGQITAKIRSIRPPEPYKGKGIKYAGEQVRRKAGKTAKA